MTDVAAWSRAADPFRRVGRAVEFHPTIASTNDRARAALADGVDGLAVVADLQTSGRGRRGRSWQSPASLNLAVSVGLRVDLAPARAGLLGIAAALATRDACEAMLPGRRLAIRWPNDVVSPDGHKLAGLLVETSLTDVTVSEVVIGIGINVNWRRDTMPPEICELAVSLADLSGREVDRVDLLERLLTRLDLEVAAIETGESPVERFRSASWLEGRLVTVDLGGSRVEGLAHGIADDGGLLLESAGRTVRLSIGEVVSVREAIGEVAV